MIAGSAKGKALKSVPGDSTRPISDRVKTALFDTLMPELEGATLLDLFGGTGAVGIEALSRGASHAVFLDLSRKAIETIRDNLRSTGLREHATVHHQDAFLYLKHSEKCFDLIYVAPPQYKSIWVRAMHAIAERPELAADGGLVIVQIDPKEYEALQLSDFEEDRQKRYGNTMLIFYRKKPL